MDPEIKQIIDQYDREAEATSWFGSEVVFGLMFKFIQPGERVLDIGIGTALSAVLFHKVGLEIQGMDISPEMLAASQAKLPDAVLQQHDLLEEPYPYSSGSMNHALCVGVMQFFEKPEVIFREAARILKPSGKFGFVFAEKGVGEDSEISVDSHHVDPDKTITLYRHDLAEIEKWSERNNLLIIRTISFPVYMSRDKKRSFRALAVITEKQA